MAEKTKYFVLKQKAVPEVLLKVVEAKRLLDSGKAVSVQEAAENVGISRSSFYKYKDDIFPFHDNAKGKTITMVIQLDDEPGLLSVVLRIVADYHANILTIHQSIPVNGIASLTLSVDVLNETGDISQMVDTIEQFFCQKMKPQPFIDICCCELNIMEPAVYHTNIRAGSQHIPNLITM